MMKSGTSSSDMFNSEHILEGLELESDYDGDVCDPFDLNKSFTVPYHLDTEVAVSTKKTYLLHMDGNVGLSRLVIALSDMSCVIYDVPNMTKLEALCGHKGAVSNVKFSPNDENLVYSSSFDGTIKLWDLRKGKECANEFKDDTEDSGKLKPLSAFDISCNGRLMCGGTECIHDDTFLLFWDLRSTKLLGGYWESHTDDVTQVKFHPTKKDILASGSTDGLINIFNVCESNEEDALQHSLNTESSVDKIGWFHQENCDDALFCITHTEDLQQWENDGACPIVQFSRDNICHLMKRKSSESCFIVNAHCTDKPEDLLLLTGSTAGRGECLRTFTVHMKQITPMSNLVGNKQIVRSSCYNRENGLLLTGGESGILSLWRPGPSSGKDSHTDLKMSTKQKFKQSKKAPY
ncbi:WD repeat-containing protein 89 [Periplaneta americana]|uniref:WD repeat-containing protein 89 n=1 Tax=Periplaneta americana TaxID=6978 RepID=UPI0037E8AF25